ncbi:Type-4 uracil-DNA glycosylase [Baekduia alba]|uniref:uracil-DNA glycosylase n=1 Tax=Baekduia alba TaxID=2997333 RepID=UPI0023415AB3|nr:uracil-DNA glycosylase [Baekduia alba]WCB93204.1 Type-4 uracil-DNA glycosylase [Baekduia alba]
MGSAGAAAELEALAQEIRAHKGAGCGFEVCETCTQLVPGVGPASAAIVIVGEAPGAKEDAGGVPFVGAAGKFLDVLLAEAGIARDDVFITNVVKARPPKNRDPKRDEVAHHWPWLERQLAIISPQLVVPLGRHALARFAPDARIADAHGAVLEVGGRRLFPLYHPAAALYNGALRSTLLDDARALGRALTSIRSTRTRGL